MQGHGQEEHHGEAARDADAAGAMSGLVAQLPVPVWLFDPELRVSYANQASAEFSSPRGAQNHIEDFSPDVQRVLTPLVRDCLEAAEPRQFDGWVTSAARGKSYWHIGCIPLPGPLVACVIIDRTAQHSAQVAMSRSEERYRELVESMAEGICVTDRDGTIEFVNPAMERMVGTSSGEMVGRTIEEYLRSERDELPVTSTAGGQESHLFEVEVPLGDDESRSLLVSMRSRLDSHGQPTGSSVLCQDITVLKRAESELKRERDFTSAVIDATSALAVVLDRQGRIVRFNRGCEEMTGYKAAEVIGHTVWEFLLVPEEIEPVKAVFADLREGRFPSHFTNMWVAKDGVRRMISWSNSVIVGADHEVEYIIAIGVDSTDRTLTEEQLRDSERRYRTLVDTMQEGVLIRDQDFNLIYINDSLCRMVGYTREELMGKFILDHLDESSLGTLMDELARRKYGEPESYELTLLAKDGREVIVSVSPAPVLDEGGNAIYNFAVFTDITERQRAERQLRESEEQFRTVVNASKDAMITIDEEGQVTLFNPAAEKVFGRSAAEMLGQQLDVLMPEEIRQLHRQYVAEYFLTGEPSRAVDQTVELTAVRADGEEFPIELSLSVGKRSDGRFVLAVIRDLSERKRLLDELHNNREN
jgi:PAS domain S-box-containing protein